MLRTGMFFVIMVSFDNHYTDPDGNAIDKYGNHNLKFFHKFLHKKKKFQYNQQHLNFFRNNMSLNASFYMESRLHDGSYAHIYVCNS